MLIAKMVHFATHIHSYLHMFRSLHQQKKKISSHACDQYGKPDQETFVEHVSNTLYVHIQPYVVI